MVHVQNSLCDTSSPVQLDILAFCYVAANVFWMLVYILSPNNEQ